MFMNAQQGCCTSYNAQIYHVQGIDGNLDEASAVTILVIIPDFACKLAKIRLFLSMNHKRRIRWAYCLSVQEIETLWLI